VTTPRGLARFCLFTRLGIVVMVLTLLLLGSDAGPVVVRLPCPHRRVHPRQISRTQCLRPAPSARNATALENAKPGTTAWRLVRSRLAGPMDLAGYTDRVSARSGESFRLYVSSTDGAFTVRAFRIGWYGARADGWCGRRRGCPGDAGAAHACASRMVTTSWQPVAHGTDNRLAGWNLPAAAHAANGKQKYVR